MNEYNNYFGFNMVIGIIPIYILHYFKPFISVIKLNFACSLKTYVF